MTPQPGVEAANLGGAVQLLPFSFLIQLYNIEFKSNFQNRTLESISKKTRVGGGRGASSKGRRDVVQLQVHPSNTCWREKEKKKKKREEKKEKKEALGPSVRSRRRGRKINK